MDSFLGEIRIFAFSYAPVDWALCDGSLIPVRQSAALYSLIGNYYGGTPNQTFALPDLRARAAQGATAPNGVGQVDGEDAVALLESQLAPHTHALAAHGSALVTSQTAGPGEPHTSYIARLVTPASGPTPAQTNRAYCKSAPGVPDCAMSLQSIDVTGGGLAHENRQPFLAMNFCISLAGEYPVRP
jgi:microcystin-dependent protein